MSQDTGADGASTQDSSGDPDSGCGSGGLLCACANSQGCTTGFCASALAVGPSLYAAAGSSNFCTVACCTSADCPGSSVCYASGAGGQYCVDPAWLGRSAAQGGLIGGASCGVDGDCRSGLCAGAACADTCCSLAYSATQCDASTVCAFGTFPGNGFDTHFAARCAPPGGTIGYGDPCGSNDQCVGGLCYNYGGGTACTNPCEANTDCPEGSGCFYDVMGNDVYAACFPTMGTREEGAACMMDTDCRSEWCQTTSLCTSTCARNADCTVVGGWTCRPEGETIDMTLMYDVLMCGP